MINPKGNRAEKTRLDDAKVFYQQIKENASKYQLLEEHRPKDPKRTPKKIQKPLVLVNLVADFFEMCLPCEIYDGNSNHEKNPRREFFNSLSSRKDS